MKHRHFIFLPLLVILFTAGCASMPRTVKRQFANSFRCPYDTVVVEETGYRPDTERVSYAASGCGQELYYECIRKSLSEVICLSSQY